MKMTKSSAEDNRLWTIKETIYWNKLVLTILYIDIIMNEQAKEGAFYEWKKRERFYSRS